MPLTKVTYSMVEDAPINVLDYADLAQVVTAKNPSDPNSHLFTSFLSWRLPIQAALDAAYNAGGGTVVLPKNTVPYYIDDVIFVKDNTTFTCDDWIILADYTTGGGSFGANGSNIVVNNLMLDNSNIYAGGSGQNGIGAGASFYGPSSGVGKNIKFNGGIIKNCARGVGGPADGGKGCQLEVGDAENIVIDGMTFSNCFMAMSTIRDFGEPDPYYGIVYSNITADNCNILFFVRQANGAQSQTGLEHTVQLNNFYAVNCGATDGVFQFSRASNVLISNGIVVNDSSVQTALIRGNHANCIFSNIAWHSDTNTCIDLTPSTYAPDDSQPNKNNRYDIQVLGQVNFFATADGLITNNRLFNCSGNVSFRLAPATAFFGFPLRNGTSIFNLSCNTGPFGASKFVVANTALNYDGSTLPYTFAGFEDGLNVSFVNGLTATTFLPIGAASVLINSVFLNSATGKISFKDSTGTTHALY